LPLTRRLLLTLPLGGLSAQNRPKARAAAPAVEFRAGDLSIQIQSRRFQVAGAELREELNEGAIEIPRAEDRRVLIVELRGEIEEPAWVSIPSNDFRAEFLTPEGPGFAPSLTFAAGDSPFRKPPPGAFFVANLRLDAGAARFRVVFLIPQGVKRMRILLPASLARLDARKVS
jgi:hypothetical protein